MPGTVQTMMVDTASDVPWVQCHPPPTGGSRFFDPTRSPTYAPFPCGSPACARLGPYGNGCINGQCQYRVTYPDGSSTLGTYSSDLLTITRTTAVRSFQFGCSQAEQGLSQASTSSSGTMSLGGGPESLVSQTAATHGNAFSYCVPPTPSDAGFFVLGKPPSSRTRTFVATPMLRFTQAPTLYRVLLRGITVAGQRLNVPATVFAAGSVMDSRTAITHLPPTAYQALRAAFRSRMGAYRLASPKGSLDTCYDFAGVLVVRVPRVALVFDRNAAVELDPSGILLDDCLAFAPTATTALRGSSATCSSRPSRCSTTSAAGPWASAAARADRAQLRAAVRPGRLPAAYRACPASFVLPITTDLAFGIIFQNVFATSLCILRWINSMYDTLFSSITLSETV